MALSIGLQLYSVRESLRHDPYGTLEAVAKTGYRYVEATNFDATKEYGMGFGVPAKELRQRLTDLGLSVIGCHVSPWHPHTLEPVLDYHQELGNTRVGCSIEFFPYNDRDSVLRRCELFNQAGELCQRRGMHFYYHNHFQEFQRFGDVSVWELIMANTEPDLVFLELDTYWIARGGEDPLALIEQHQDRLLLLHQKDFPKDAPHPLVMYDGLVDPQQDITMDVFASRVDPRCFTEIGTGILPIQDIIHTASPAPKLDYVLLEQDHSQLGELESIQVSKEAFQKFTGVAFD